MRSPTVTWQEGHSLVTFTEKSKTQTLFLPSGHKEGSKAFQRNRDFDEEMKRALVKLLD